MVVAAFKLKQQIAKYNQAMEVKDSEKQKRQLIWYLNNNVLPNLRLIWLRMC